MQAFLLFSNLTIYRDTREFTLNNLPKAVASLFLGTGIALFWNMIVPDTSSRILENSMKKTLGVFLDGMNQYKECLDRLSENDWPEPDSFDDASKNIRSELESLGSAIGNARYEISLSRYSPKDYKLIFKHMSTMSTSFSGICLPFFIGRGFMQIDASIGGYADEQNVSLSPKLAPSHKSAVSFRDDIPKDGSGSKSFTGFLDSSSVHSLRQLILSRRHHKSKTQPMHTRFHSEEPESHVDEEPASHTAPPTSSQGSKDSQSTSSSDISIGALFITPSREKGSASKSDSPNRGRESSESSGSSSSEKQKRHFPCILYIQPPPEILDSQPSASHLEIENLLLESIPRMDKLLKITIDSINVARDEFNEVRSRNPLVILQVIAFDLFRNVFGTPEFLHKWSFFSRKSPRDSTDDGYFGPEGLFESHNLEQFLSRDVHGSQFINTGIYATSTRGLSYVPTSSRHININIARTRSRGRLDYMTSLERLKLARIKLKNEIITFEKTTGFFIGELLRHQSRVDMQTYECLTIFHSLNFSLRENAKSVLKFLELEIKLQLKREDTWKVWFPLRKSKIFRKKTDLRTHREHEELRERENIHGILSDDEEYEQYLGQNTEEDKGRGGGRRESFFRNIGTKAYRQVTGRQGDSPPLQTPPIISLSNTKGWTEIIESPSLNDGSENHNQEKEKSQEENANMIKAQRSGNKEKGGNTEGLRNRGRPPSSIRNPSTLSIPSDTEPRAAYKLITRIYLKTTVVMYKFLLYFDEWLARDETKYSIKYTVAIMVWAIWAYLEFSRGYYQRHRGNILLLATSTVLNQSAGASLFLGIDRILATIVGAGWAVISYLSSNQGELYGVAFVFLAIFAVPAQYVAIYVPDHASAIPSLYVAFISVFYGTISRTSVLPILQAALGRFICNLIGVVFAIIVSWWIWTFRSRTHAHQLLAEMFDYIGAMLAQLHSMQIAGHEYEETFQRSLAELDRVSERMLVSIAEVKGAISNAEKEPSLHGSFDTDLHLDLVKYMEMERESILNAANAAKYVRAEMTRIEVRSTGRLRRDLLASVLVYSHLMAGSLRSGHPLPPYLPDVRQARLRLTNVARKLWLATGNEANINHSSLRIWALATWQISVLQKNVGDIVSAIVGVERYHEIDFDEEIINRAETVMDLSNLASVQTFQSHESPSPSPFASPLISPTGGGGGGGGSGAGGYFEQTPRRSGYDTSRAGRHIDPFYHHQNIPESVTTPTLDSFNCGVESWYYRVGHDFSTYNLTGRTRALSVIGTRRPLTLSNIFPSHLPSVHAGSLSIRSHFRQRRKR
ncbi:hypothetical protein H4219_002655 [Mycoemilia scoparia]|uniref:Integral membrane bound transporter domain-containing protein n=1 Tax=Mycoemilia scoparia TaxID=417184 RepID=A0A9W8A2S1_9FUNG|nr:hypothetical protein H4219_002655 [Mycoemilia scoparia]